MKNPVLQNFINDLSRKAYTRTPREAFIAGVCVKHGTPVGSFRDTESAHEYHISGYCQACQDIVFGRGAE